MTCTYHGNCDSPRNGQLGQAWKAQGYNDPESCEFRAWMFSPDNEDDAAYYCEESELHFVAV